MLIVCGLQHVLSQSRKLFLCLLGSLTMFTRIATTVDTDVQSDGLGLIPFIEDEIVQSLDALLERSIPWNEECSSSELVRLIDPVLFDQDILQSGERGFGCRQGSFPSLVLVLQAIDLDPRIFRTHCPSRTNVPRQPSWQ